MGTNKNSVMFRYSVTASVLGILNILFLQNKPAAYCLIAMECLIVIFLLFKRDFCESFSMLLIITAISIGSSTFAGSELFYSFNSFRILGVDLIAWILLLYTVFALAFGFIAKPIPKPYRTFLIRFIALVIIATFMGLICILFDDNNITRIDSFPKYFIAIFYIMAFIPLTIILSTYVCYSVDKSNFYKIKFAILAVFCGNAFQAFFSVLVGFSINYSGIEGIGIPLSPVYFYMPLAVCSFFYDNDYEGKTPFIYLLVILAGLFLIIKNNANGKLLLLAMLTPLLSFGISGSKNKLLLIIFSVIGALGIFAFFVLGDNIGSNYLLAHKLKEVVGLLDIFSDNWLQKMPMSPRYRILELINISEEYVSKPWLLITGKGYLGSVTDHINGFIRVGGDFSDVQWNHGVFFFLHESLNLLFLNNGLLGVAFWISMLIQTIKNCKKSFYILLGGIWFCLTYGYSVPITIVGMTSLCIGLLELKVCVPNSNEEVLN